MKTKLFISTATALLIIAIVLGFKDQLFKPMQSQPNGEVTLEWDMSPGDIAGYKIYYGSESGKYFQAKGQGIDIKLTNSPTQPKYTLTNLEVGKTYFFTVTTYDSKGVESEFAGEVSKIVSPKN